MAEEYLDQLADEMQRLGDFTDGTYVAPGVWEGKIDMPRIINHDETSQFINYCVDDSACALLYAAKGDECKKLLFENRDCVTINPFVTLSGTVPLCHIVFKGSGITSQMATEKAADDIDDLFISTTENGAQGLKSLLSVYKHLDRVIKQRGIRKPVLLLADGHTSRFDLDVMTFLQEKEVFLNISSPDTTAVTQLLDQINHSIHDCYR